MSVETATVYDSDDLAVRIVATSPAALTAEANRVLSRATERAWHEIKALQLASDPEQIELVAKDYRELTALFGDRAIYVAEIPNGYCSSWCCKHRPWYQVTTSVGLIVVGWRKSEISIDWSDTTVESSAEELFPTEDVTKSGQLIHAWGYAHAKRYIEKVLEAK